MNLKKFAAGAVAAGMLLTGTSAFAAAENIIINGQSAQIPADMGTIKEMDGGHLSPSALSWRTWAVRYSSLTRTKWR